MIKWMKYKVVYFVISTALLIVGITSLFMWGLRLGIDFTGGVVAEYRLPNGEIKLEKFGTKSEEEINKIQLCICLLR